MKFLRWFMVFLIISIASISFAYFGESPFWIDPMGTADFSEGPFGEKQAEQVFSAGDALLLETGDYILLESGDKILFE